MNWGSVGHFLSSISHTFQLCLLSEVGVPINLFKSPVGVVARQDYPIYNFTIRYLAAQFKVQYNREHIRTNNK